MENITVALVQYAPVWENPEANFRLLDEMIQDLKSGTDIVLLPEMFQTGFTMRSEMSAYAHSSLEWLIAKAKQKNVIMGASLMVRENEKLYNRFYWVTPDGIVDYYDKKHLFRMGKEDEVMSAGQRRVIVSYKQMRFMLQICYDLRFPVFSRNRYTNGQYDYDALIYIANWPQIRRNAYDILLPARAVENQAYVIWVNRTGKDNKGVLHSGDSRLICPSGNIIKQAKAFENQILYCELDRQKLPDHRRAFQVARDWD